MKRMIQVGFLVFLVLMLTACSDKPKLETYKGDMLTIGVLGKAPEVKEEQVTFKEISFNEFDKETVVKYDAVFIMPENLVEASDGKYQELYMESHVPFFFVDSKQGFYPFVEKELTYNDKGVPETTDYVTGMLRTKDHNMKTWTYGLMDDERTDEYVQEVYSRIFQTVIEEKGEPVAEAGKEK